MDTGLHTRVHSAARLDPHVADRVLRPTGEAGGLPNGAYTDWDWMRLEADQLFARTWTCIGLVSDVPNPGDVSPVTVAGRPLVLVRDKQGALRVFHNVCSHRGVQLVRAPQTGKPLLVCPYHSWSYRLDGALHKTPHFGGHGDHTTGCHDRAKMGLKPVRAAEWAGLVFVNLSGDAVPFADHIAPLAERWRHFDFSLLRHGETLPFEINANWKLVIENYIEHYHLPTVHPNLNRYSGLDVHYQITSDANYVGQGSSNYAPKDGAVGVLPMFPNLPVEVRKRAEYICLFPNVMIGCLADHVYSFIVLPERPDFCRERFDFFFVGDRALAPELAEARRTVAMRRFEINTEDIDIVERLQAGRASPAFDGGYFSATMEDTVHQFQRLVVEALQPAASTAA